MAPAKVALGLAAALPALLLGATMLAAAVRQPDAPRLAGALSAGAIIGGVAFALAGLLKDHRGWVHGGALAMVVGAAPMLRQGLAVVVLLSAALLVVLSRPAADPRQMRAAARVVTTAGLAFLALLAWRNHLVGRAATPLDALLWVALVVLAAYAWWPSRRQGSLRA